MVKIKEFTEEEAETTEDETTKEEEDDEKPLDPPDALDPSLAPLMFSAPEPSAPEGTAAGPSVESHTSDVISPIFRFGLGRQYIWYLLRQYGHSIEFKRSFQEAHGSIMGEGLSKWATELQQLAGPPNGNGDPQLACSISAPDTPAASGDRNIEDNRSTNRTASIFERTASIYDAEGSSQITEEFSDRDEGNKTESDELTKEKSNGVGEKVQLATTSTGAKAGLSSPELSDYELSDVSDSLAPPDYESLQADLNEDYTPTALMDCPWAKYIGQTFGIDDVDPELKESANKEPSKASDDGESAALPASSVVKDCWEEWVDDNRLFTLAAEAPAPCSSTVVTPRVPSPASMSSPASPTTERSRVKLENRQRVRQQATKPLTRFIFVPTENIGRIVGKGGRRVKEIEKESGAKIKVDPKKSAKPVPQITLSGTEEEILKADEEICVIIRNFKPPVRGEPTTASVSSVEEMELKRLLLGIKNQVLDGEKRCRKPAG